METLQPGGNLPPLIGVDPPNSAAVSIGGGNQEMEERIMWLSFFSIAVAASIFLGVAAVMVQNANHGDTLNY